MPASVGSTVRGNALFVPVEIGMTGADGHPSATARFVPSPPSTTTAAHPTSPIARAAAIVSRTSWCRGATSSSTRWSSSTGSAARRTMRGPSLRTTKRSAPHCAAPMSTRRTAVTLSLSVDVDAFATSRRMSLPEAGFAMRPIGAGTGADATERGPKVPACSAPSGTSSRTSWSGSPGHPASAPTSTPGSSAVAEEARRTSLRSAPPTAPRLASSAR